jgi:cation diffusion facilitator family transporter
MDMMADGSTKVVYAALLGNGVVAATKFGAAALSGSSAMLTEALHSSADTINQCLLLFGNKRSRAKADATHAFGYGMEIYFWTFVVAVLVLIAGGGASLWKGVQHLRHPQQIESAAVSLIVLALSAIFEGASFLVAYREYKRIAMRHTIPNLHIGLWRFIDWSKDPNLYESLLEDLGALVGVAIAALGICSSVYLHLAWADGLASCAIGVLLIVDALLILMATRSLIAGEAAALPLLKDIREAVRAGSPGFDIAEAGTLHLGPRTILVCLKVNPTPNTSVAALQNGLDDAERRVRAVDRRIQYVLFRFGGARTGHSAPMAASAAPLSR